MSKVKKSLEEFKEDPQKWSQDSWDNMDQKQVKNYNLLIKTLAGILAIMLLLLSIVYPICLVLAIACIVFISKFDARKRQTSYKNRNK